MPLSDLIGAISAIAGLYDFIDGKLKNDYRAFVSQIEKNIRVACKNFANDLAPQKWASSMLGRRENEVSPK